MKRIINVWDWYTHKKTGLKMEVTKVRNKSLRWEEKVCLWDAKMQFSWSGSRRSFFRQFKKGI